MSGLRDIAVTLFIFGMVPFILRRPWIGVLMWVWISVMSPHRQTWGFAYDLPFGQVVAIATFAGILLWRGHKHLPLTSTTVGLMLLFAWFHVSLAFAVNYDGSLAMYDKVFKIFLMLFVTLYLLHSKQHVQWLVVILTVSIAYYGTKGGRFTLLGGGGERVYGPGGSFIEENNALAVAVIMTILLLRWCQLQLKKKWQRLAVVPVMLLCAVSAFGSQSRGALLAIGAMTAFLWLKARNKFLTLIVIVMAAPVIYNFMPERWHERMSTIQTYDEDNSAMGRLDAWEGAFKLANHRLTGGGFDIYGINGLAQYTPSGGSRSAHSIWFQILGEHGWVGLFLFIGLWWLVWRDGSWIIRQCGKREDLAWAADLARMIQVSLIGYFAGGTFLQLAYYDVPYNLIIAVVLTRILVAKETGANENKGWYGKRNQPGAVPVVASSAPATSGLKAPVAARPRGLGGPAFRSVATPWRPRKSG